MRQLAHAVAHAKGYGCLLLVLSVWSGIAHAQRYTYSYEDGTRIPLTVDTSKTFVLYKPDVTLEKLLQSTKSTGAVLERFDVLPAWTGLDLTAESTSPQPTWAIIDNANAVAAPLFESDIDDNVLYSAPFYRTPDQKQVGVSHLLYVKLNAPEDLPLLEAQAKRQIVEIIGNNKQLPLWYTLSCTKHSQGNALKIANKLRATKLFAFVEPDYLIEFSPQSAGEAPPCADDALFNQQWGLKNTGQRSGTPGVDIGACDAWATATGLGVKVAVVDDGIQSNHPDLMANISPLGFDTEAGTGPSMLRGAHGTLCAGIIAASRNNAQLGVVGVAPDATLISVSDSLLVRPNMRQQLASGIAWAAQNGADVISNSWGHDTLSSQIINDAIIEAHTNGRGGKGCVVVFAAGNNGGSVVYPARANPAVLAVGASSPCAQRKNASSCDHEPRWSSCYGSELDITAPGVFIATTDLTGSVGKDTTDYTLGFNGSSAATPHVAGVAALILQVNPNLTHSEVVAIIEQNAKKVGAYNYQTTPGRPHGTWHQEMGYGLVNAKACVDAAAKTASPG